MEKFEMKQLTKLFRGICKPVKRLDNGHSGFCRIYEAQLPKKAGKAVLKVYDLAAQEMTAMMQEGEVREIRYYQQLTYDIFPKFISSGRVGEGENQFAYMLINYLPDARTLQDSISTLDPQDTIFSTAALLELAFALNKLQQLPDGGAHYYLLPDNVLISGGHVYLSGTTQIGEPHPEQGTFSDDVYAYCSTACFLLTGQYPDETAALELDNENLQQLLLRGLNKDSDQRFPNIEAMLEPLREALHVGIMPTEETERQPEHKREEDRSCQVSINKRQGKGFAEVAGMESLKKTLTRDFVKVTQNLELARAYNITPPNVVLYGPPGCGKTFIANKLAEECGLSYSYVKPSDVGSTYVHGTQGKIADLFEKAAQQAPCLLCIDEIDALIPQRGSSQNDTQNDEVAEWLTQLNECTDKGVYVVAMTNRISAIDEAVLRRGRFDAKFYVPLPSQEEREELFRLSLAQCPSSSAIDIPDLARQTERYSSSDIVSIVKDAAREAFDRTVDAGQRQPIPVSQELLLEVLHRSHPSLSAAALQHYEREREKFEGKAESHTRIGFHV